MQEKNKKKIFVILFSFPRIFCPKIHLYTELSTLSTEKNDFLPPFYGNFFENVFWQNSTNNI